MAEHGDRDGGRAAGRVFLERPWKSSECRILAKKALGRSSDALPQMRLDGGPSRGSDRIEGSWRTISVNLSEVFS